MEDWALFYGILAGDGCLSNSCSKYFISISGNLKDDIPFFEEIVVPLLSRLRSKNVVYRKKLEQNKLEINFSDKPLFNKLIILGFPIGKKMYKNLILPKKLESSFPDFVSGLMATDGSLWFRHKRYHGPYPVIGIKNKCRSLVYQVYNYLKLLDLNPKLREVKYRNKSLSGEYEIAIYGHKNTSKFRKLVGFINPKHRLKYDKFLA